MLVKVKRSLSKLYLKAQLKNQGTFKSDKCDLKYLFFKNRKSDKLLVIFSGFPPRGKQPLYNYIMKFKNLNCNKLYILDDFGNDSRGSYYLGENGDYYVADAVNGLIGKITRELSINNKDVITAGSSKGGYAAMYFALQNNYKAAVVGEPQVLLGDYLMIPEHREIMDFIQGNHDDDSKTKLNNLLFDLIQEKSEVDLFIHVGENGEHHHEHVLPLTQHLDNKNIKYDLNLGDYTEHGGVGIYYPPYAIKTINSLL